LEEKIKNEIQGKRQRKRRQEKLKKVKEVLRKEIVRGKNFQRKPTIRGRGKKAIVGREDRE